MSKKIICIWFKHGLKLESLRKNSETKEINWDFVLCFISACASELINSANPGSISWP